MSSLDIKMGLKRQLLKYNIKMGLKRIDIEPKY